MTIAYVAADSALPFEACSLGRIAHRCPTTITAGGKECITDRLPINCTCFDALAGDNTTNLLIAVMRFLQRDVVLVHPCSKCTDFIGNCSGV